MRVRQSAYMCCFAWAALLVLSRPLLVHANPDKTPASSVQNSIPADNTSQTWKSLELQLMPQRKADADDTHGIALPQHHSGIVPLPPAKKSLGPVYIDLVQRVAVRRAIPLYRRRGTLASRSGAAFRIVYERQFVPVDISPLIVKHAEAYKVDPFLVKAIISVESNFRNAATSCCGAQGLMQLMPGTGRMMGARDLYDPSQNIAAGTRYLRGLLDIYRGNVRSAVAAYNAGPGNVSKSGAIPNIPETRNYVRKVMRAYKQFLEQSVAAQP